MDPAGQWHCSQVEKWTLQHQRFMRVACDQIVEKQTAAQLVNSYK